MVPFYNQRITIRVTRKPADRNINNELQWLGSSLGLFNLRDKDKSCFRIFIELIKSTKTKHPLSSDEMALRLGLSRGTVVHHINKLIDFGIVIHDNRRYLLRVNNLHELINEMEKDFARALEDLKKVADDIDKRLGL